MKKTVSLFIILVLLIGMAIMPVYAEGEDNQAIPEERQLPLLYDSADLLSNDEEIKLWERLESITNEYKCEVAVVTVPTLAGSSSQAFADDFFDYNGYGYGDADDGIMLLVGVQERDAAITTYGLAIDLFTDYKQDTMWDKMLPHLGEDDWFGAFMAFATSVEEVFMTTGSTSDDIYVYDDKIDVKIIFYVFLASLLLAFIIVNGMRMKLKSVRRQAAAHEYVVPGSFVLTNSMDNFLFTNTSRVRKAESSGGGGSSTHRSSSGRSHGGSSRKF